MVQLMLSLPAPGSLPVLIGSVVSVLNPCTWCLFKHALLLKVPLAGHRRRACLILIDLVIVLNVVGSARGTALLIRRLGVAIVLVHWEVEVNVLKIQEIREVIVRFVRRLPRSRPLWDVLVVHGRGFGGEGKVL